MQTNVNYHVQMEKIQSSAQRGADVFVMMLARPIVFVQTRKPAPWIVLKDLTLLVVIMPADAFVTMMVLQCVSATEVNSYQK